MNRKTALFAAFLLAVPSLAALAQQPPDEENAMPVAMEEDEGMPPEGGPAPENRPGTHEGMMPGAMMGEKGAMRGHGMMMRGGMMGKMGKMDRKGPMGDGMFGGEGMDRMIEQIRKDDPALADKLEKMKKEKPFIFHAVIRDVAPKLFMAGMSGDKELRANAVKMFRLEVEIRELSWSYKKDDKADKDRIKKELQEKLAQEFDVKLALDQARVKMLSKEVDELKTRVEKRKTAKAALVGDRLAEALGEKETW
ncbi:MAG: hypothetical protein PHP45_00195 [Elusimicrobiales bacterium]|nr:hypothetical protein [Elusimicrobiales bacterium]